MSTPKTCALCGQKLANDRENYVTGITGNAVCTACMETSKIVHTIQAPKEETPPQKILTPQALVAELDQSIIGQQNAKQAIALALWKQQLRANGEKDVPSSPLLLYGPTGCGKTALVREAARLVDLPFLIFDATTLSETGYRGRDAQDMVNDLAARYDGHKNLPYGVILLDEADKLAARGSSDRVAYCRATQHAMLKVIEGIDLETKSGIQMNTADLLFVLGGAFTGLAHRNTTKHCIGFDRSSETHVTSSEPTTEDFIAFGMEPELLGRIPRKVRMEKLTHNELRSILLDSRLSVYRKYQAFFKNHGITLDLDDASLDKWIIQAAQLGTGARGLQAVVEQEIEPLLFRLAQHEGDQEEVWRDAV